MLDLPNKIENKIDRFARPQSDSEPDLDVLPPPREYSDPTTPGKSPAKVKPKSKSKKKKNAPQRKRKT